MEPTGSPPARHRVLVLLRVSLALAAGSLTIALMGWAAALRDALLVGALMVALGALIVAARVRR